MILFCDTSALIKLYIAEEGGEMVRQAAVDATALAVCRIAWAEAMAALARRVREMPTDEAAISLARAHLRRDWGDCLIVEVTQILVEQAGEFADVFALRGYDSIQLAAAHALHVGSGAPVHFAVFDTRLQKAARILGMKTLS